MSLVHLLVDWTHLRQATELKMFQQKPPKLKAIRRERGGKKKRLKRQCIRMVGQLLLLLSHFSRVRLCETL